MKKLLLGVAMLCLAASCVKPVGMYNVQILGADKVITVVSEHEADELTFDVDDTIYVDLKTKKIDPVNADVASCVIIKVL